MDSKIPSGAVNVVTNATGFSRSKEVTRTANVQTNNIAKMNKSENATKNLAKKYPNKAEEFWPEIVSDLKQNGKIVLYTNLINTKAVELNDMTIGIEFPKELTPFGKTILEIQENIREISTLVSMACGKEMQIKYITQEQQINKPNNEDDLKNLANESNIPFNIIE